MQDNGRDRSAEREAPVGPGGALTVTLPEALTREWVEREFAALERAGRPLVLDFRDTRRVDSAGLSMVQVLKRREERRGRKLVLANVSREVHDALGSWQGRARPAEPPAPGEGLFARVGSAALAAAERLQEALSVLAEMLYWGTLGALRRRDFRQGCLGEQMYLLGYKAIVIVGLLSFLIGIVVALQSAMFLRTYGAGIYLASMIGWSMVKEFGPLLTAIILAGRTGSATTAEIATMGVAEEIDALKTMGISHYQFVVAPKFWAITVTMPPLSMLASAAGIFGAFLVSLLYLDIAASLFWSELWKYIALRDVAAGLVKSVVFAWLIIWIGAYYGLRVRGGAEEVGRETTASVVTCIFVIILADAAFSFVF